MKKSRKILLTFLVLIAIIAAVCVWQRNNLKAVKLWLESSQDDINTQMQDNQQKVVDAAQKVSGVTIHDITEEQKQALKDNTLTREELIQQMVTGVQTPVTSDQPASQPTYQPEAPEQVEIPSESLPPQPEPQPTQPTKQPPQSEPIVTPETQEPEMPAIDPDREQLAKYIADIYLMQTEYTTWLEDMNQAAIDEFVALPKDQKTTSAKYTIGLRYMKTALEKEDECDAKMAKLEAAIKDLLIKLGEDTALVDEIHATYLEEKALKKAYYLSLH